MPNTHSISFNSDVSPIEFAKLIFECTNKNGNITFEDWYDVKKDDTVSFKNFTCKIEWIKEDVDKLIDSYKSLHRELRIISRSLDELNEIHLSQTNPYIETSNGILESKHLEATYFIYVAPFKASNKAQLEAEIIGRVGNEPFGFEMIRHAQRLCRLMQLKSPEKVIFNEGRMLIASMAIYYCGKEIEQN